MHNFNQQLLKPSFFSSPVESLLITRLLEELSGVKGLYCTIALGPIDELLTNMPYWRITVYSSNKRYVIVASGRPSFEAIAEEIKKGELQCPTIKQHE